jgi:eukaryotic-like serine/threonine-protein kinase
VSAPLEHLRLALADRYTVTAVLGEGGMATVYRATDLRHQREVAIKVLRGELSEALGHERFLQEIEIAARLQHPRILPVYDSGDANGMLYFVMPLVEGESLRDRLNREKQLPLADALRIIREVASALTYAHARGVVHRDIKPENVLLFAGESVVADFGIARALHAASESRLTITGVSIGTPAYMSPEQVLGERDADVRSDVYSLGCLLYELLAGQAPYTGATIESVLRQHVAAPVPRITTVRSAVTLAVEQVIERALSKAPADRFASAAELAQALTTTETGAVERPAVTAAPSGRRSRRRWLMGATLGVAAAGAAGVWLARREAVATDPARIAVMPFRVTGDSTLTYLREGMVDLLTTQMGSMNEARPLESRTVLAAWRRAFRSGDDPSRAEARQLAAGLGSGRFVLGEIVRVGNGIQIAARMIDVDSDRQADAMVQGSPGELFTLVDRLTSQLLVRSAGEPAGRLADLISTSLPAVRAYLDGRAAYRRGELERAVEHFTRALEADSTFALAALGMASVGVWSQQAGRSAALSRGLRTAYALRDRIPRRDQLLFEAYVPPDTAVPVLAAQQLAAWKRAAEGAPDSPEALYEYGDRLYHSGEQLGITSALQLARSTFERALRLDSTFAAPLAHLVEIAARSRDRKETQRLVALYRGDAADADVGDYVGWRVAAASGERRTLETLRQRLDRMEPAAIDRIIGFGQADAVELSDVDAAAGELRRRLNAGTTWGVVPLGQSLHSWAMNRGNRSEAANAIAALRAREPIAPGSTIVFFNADQVPVLDALFWDGDSTAAREGVARLEASIARGEPRASGLRARYYADVCVTVLWRLATKATDAEALVARLRTGAGVAVRDSVAQYGMDPQLCLSMAEAWAAASQGAPDSRTRLASLDARLADGPYVFGMDFGNLWLARAYETSGDRAAALRAVRRRPYDWDTAPLYLTRYLHEEGRLAAATGDSVGVARAWGQFVAMREGADRVYQPQTDSVRRALATLHQ